MNALARYRVTAHGMSAWEPSTGQRSTALQSLHPTLPICLSLAPVSCLKGFFLRPRSDSMKKKSRVRFVLHKSTLVASLEIVPRRAIRKKILRRARVHRPPVLGKMSGMWTKGCLWRFVSDGSPDGRIEDAGLRELTALLGRCEAAIRRRGQVTSPKRKASRKPNSRGLTAFALVRERCTTLTRIDYKIRSQRRNMPRSQRLRHFVLSEPIQDTGTS